MKITIQFLQLVYSWPFSIKKNLYANLHLKRTHVSQSYYQINQLISFLLFMFMSGTIIILTFYNSFLLIIIVISTAKLLFTTSLFDRKIFLIWQKRKKVIMVWAKWGCSLNYVNTKGRKKKEYKKTKCATGLLNLCKSEMENILTLSWTPKRGFKTQCCPKRRFNSMETPWRVEGVCVLGSD